MKSSLRIGFVLCIIAGGSLLLPISVSAEDADSKNADILHCIAFSPYVGDLDPDYGPHPTPKLINKLLDKLVKQTSFRCIMTYGVLNGLDYTFEAAKQREIKVIAIIWLDQDEAVNNASIELGIQKAKEYPDTIIRLSCGSEVRTRHGVALDHVIRDCIARFRAASVIQPITSIDTWWEWCNRSWHCQTSDLAPDMDWIGINVFPWWENKYSGIFPCTTAAEAAEFHIARLQDVSAQYPEKKVVLTEFGWPAKPRGYTEENRYTGQRCGVASERNQNLVIRETFAKLDEGNWSGVMFEAFRERWKERYEGPVGPYWGICLGKFTPHM